MNTPIDSGIQSLDNKKYRPSLTVAQIKRIHTLTFFSFCMDEVENNKEVDRSILQLLAPFIAKIENDAISPAYTPIPKKDILEQLGGESDAAIIAKSNKVAYNAACYSMYLENPLTCSLSKIAAAKEHMYVNDLMTQTEEVTYEQSI